MLGWVKLQQTTFKGPYCNCILANSVLCCPLIYTTHFREPALAPAGTGNKTEHDKCYQNILGYDDVQCG